MNYYEAIHKFQQDYLFQQMEVGFLQDHISQKLQENKNLRRIAELKLRGMNISTLEFNYSSSTPF